jgi:hypothetical protein
MEDRIRIIVSRDYPDHLKINTAQYIINKYDIKLEVPNFIFAHEKIRNDIFSGVIIHVNFLGSLLVANKDAYVAILLFSIKSENLCELMHVVNKKTWRMGYDDKIPIGYVVEVYKKLLACNNFSFDNLELDYDIIDMLNVVRDELYPKIINNQPEVNLLKKMVSKINKFF